jgi:hypothetical protein
MAIILRAFGGIVAAMLVAFVLLIAVEFFSSVVHPTPPDFQGTMEEMCQHVERYPHWVLAVVVPAWAGTALASTWIAGRLGGRGCALVIGVLLLAGLVFNVSMLPYPIWFKIVSLIAIPLAIVSGVYLTGQRIARPIS